MKVAILWLVNEKGEILMARRAAHMDTDAGVWGPSVSGKVDTTESFEEAVLREAHEELGLAPTDISPVFLHNELYTEHTDGQRRDFGLYYATVPSDIISRLKLEPNEVSEVKWFKQSDLRKLADQKSESLIISSATELWRRIFAHLQPLAS